MCVVRWLTAGVVVLGSAILVPAYAAEPVNPNRFEAIHSVIKPKAAEEKWEQIPWMASLWAARERAAREGKPILLWEMDGHPLGCV